MIEKADSTSLALATIAILGQAPRIIEFRAQAKKSLSVFTATEKNAND
jgi:hypothetical protein